LVIVFIDYRMLELLSSFLHFIFLKDVQRYKKIFLPHPSPQNKRISTAIFLDRRLFFSLFSSRPQRFRLHTHAIPVIIRNFAAEIKGEVLDFL